MGDSKADRRAALEQQLAALDAEDDGPGVDAVDIQDGDRSVRFTGKGAVGQAEKWLRKNFSDLFDAPDDDGGQDQGDGQGGGQDPPGAGVRRFGGRRVS